MMELFSNRTQWEGFLLARPLPMWLAIGAVLVIAVYVLASYRSERGLRLRWRIALAAARGILLLLVGLMLLEPFAAIKQERLEKRGLAVLIDRSQSMDVRDQRKSSQDVMDAAVALGYALMGRTDVEQPPELTTRQRQTIRTSSRADMERNLLTGSAAGVFDSLSKDLNVRYYAFGGALEMLGHSASELGAQRTDSGCMPDITAIADALMEAGDTYRDGSLSGIVLLSDGVDTSNHQPQVVAHELGLRGIPIYVVPIGVRDPDDVSIRHVVVQDVAFVGDTVPVRVQIRSRGYEKRTTDLVLRFNGGEVARQQVELQGGLQTVDLAFDNKVRSKEAAKLEIEIEPFADEATAGNNTTSRSIRVVNEKVNVLCIEGSARWEFRYLRAILKRDPRIRATFVATRNAQEMALNSSDYIVRFPEDPQQAFKYDLVILGDVESKFFTPAELSRLEELIRDRGGSLLMLAGPEASPSSYTGTVVEKMLPVRFDPDDKWRDVDSTVYPVLTEEGRTRSVLKLENDLNLNSRIWSRVAPMDRLPPLLGARPGASVLATLSDAGSTAEPYPLISWQRYGTGKCMMIATDRLWRLRYRTGDKYHWRLWSQCIQFLTLSRLLGEHKPIRMETDRTTYPVGDQVRIYAEVLDNDYQPVLRESYDVNVEPINDDGSTAPATRVSLRPDATHPGLYVGYYAPRGAGRYRIEAVEDDRDRANTIEFQAATTSPELADVDANPQLLDKLAELSGGRAYKLADMSNLARDIDRSPQQASVLRDVALWDNWLVAGLLIVLAGFEWISRRRFDLR